MTKTASVGRVVLGVAFVATLSMGHRAVAAQDQNPPQQDARAAAVARVLESKACQQCDLSGAAFEKDADLKAADFTGAKLIGTFFYRTDLTNANFSNADLSKANFSLANLSNANFGGANLDGATLTGATSANLAGATTTATTVCPDGQAGPCR